MCTLARSHTSRSHTTRSHTSRSRISRSHTTLLYATPYNRAHNSYDWILACPGADERYYDTEQVELFAGPNEANDVDTTGATGPVVCSLSLTVTDADGLANTAETTVTVK